MSTRRQTFWWNCIFLFKKREQCGENKIHSPEQQYSSLDVAGHPQHPWLVASAKSADLFSCLLHLQFCWSAWYWSRNHLADIVLWIKLEEFPLLGGFKAIFLQLISAERSFFKVFCNLRSYDVREQTLSCNRRGTSSLAPVGNVRFQFETFQVRNHQLRDHGTDSNKLPAGECQPGGPSPPTFIMRAWSTFTGEFRHPVSPPPQTLRQPGQNTHDSLGKKANTV